jgi:methionyl-tRNA formyltransferase
MGNSEIDKNNFKILFITQEDPFYIKTFFQEFLNKYPYKKNIAGVVICSTMGKTSILKQAKQMYNFYGFIDFVRMGLRYVRVKLSGKDISHLMQQYNIPVYFDNNINDDIFINYWAKQNIDVIVSVAAPKIFREKLLKLPKKGCINMHSAKLPFYKGMMPVFWQMFYGEKTIGLTIHEMNDKLDEGKIILQKETAINPEESLDTLIKRTKKMMAYNLIEVLELCKKNKITYLPKSEEPGSYYTFPTKEEVSEFRRKGKKIL